MEKRRYTLRRRAEQQQRTRRRIIEAMIALHEEIGPKATTISAIAERAGVQRLTVYRHFPEEEVLLLACTSHWLEDNPPPDPAQWAPAREPEERSRTAFASLYRYYRRTERMWDRAYRDVEEVPALRKPVAGFERYLDGIRSDLLATWVGHAGSAHGLSPALEATIGHCLRFSTWQTLAREGLDDERMADLARAWLGGVVTAATFEHG